MLAEYNCQLLAVTSSMTTSHKQEPSKYVRQVSYGKWKPSQSQIPFGVKLLQSFDNIC